MLRLAPQFFWWLTPVLVGLIFGIPLTMWTSRTGAGRRLRRWGLLLTPEETAPPRELLGLCQNVVDMKVARAPAEAVIAASTTGRKPTPPYLPAQRKSG